MEANRGTRGPIVVALVSLLICLVAVCCGGMFFLGVGWNLMTEDIAVALEEDPLIQEHIGPINSMQTEWSSSFEEDGEIFVYHIEGEKGVGRVKVHSDVIDGATVIQKAELQLEDGRTFPLLFGRQSQ